jgi:hypothetical protein
MVDVKRKKQTKKSKQIEYHKWIDMRVIIPSIIIAFVFSIFVYLYVNEAVIIMAVWSYLSAVYGLALFAETDGIVFAVSKIAFFTADFIVVFFISYVVLWLIAREEDKRLYKKYKKEGLLK